MSELLSEIPVESAFPETELAIKNAINHKYEAGDYDFRDQEEEEEAGEEEKEAVIDESKQPEIIQQISTFKWGRFLGSFSINLVLPFINGLMLGFGEIIAHEIGFHFNWVGAKIYRPVHSRQQQQQQQNYTKSKYI